MGLCEQNINTCQSMAKEKPVTCIAAFCNGNRGIGYKGGLPWPFLEEDNEFYQAYSVKTKDPAKKNGFIYGRLTWDPNATPDPKYSKKDIVVVSQTLPKDTPNVYAVAKTFGEAVDIFCSPEADHIENISVLGGTKIYEAAIADPRCKRLVLTRVFQDFPFDAYFPPFEHCFEKVEDPEVDGRLRENNGVKFQFEVWERKSS